MLFVFLFVAFASAGSIVQEGAMLVHKNGGPQDYHVDINNPYRLVDPINQMMAVGINIVLGHSSPKSMYNVGLGMGCIERQYLSLFPSLQIKTVDIDYHVIEEWGKMNNNYFAEYDSITMENRRLKITPDDGKTPLKTIYSDKKFDVISVDVADAEYKNPQNLLHDKEFWALVKSHVHHGAVINLFGSDHAFLKSIQANSGMPVALHLTPALKDSASQKAASVLILGHMGLSCASLEESYKRVPSHTIQKPLCRTV
jgi:spermidine synthase